MAPRSQEVENALHMQLTDKRIEDLEAIVLSLTQDRSQALKWGIMTLGAAVLGMATFIFNLVWGKN